MLTISDQWLRRADMTEAEIRKELALLLLERQRISFEEARELAEMGTLDFLALIKERGIELEFTIEDLEHDLQTLRRLNQL
ncbi:MAG: UPF0175 family protein [Saprospiraceae bacterium]|nr:UPF0175 family protein [Saprospiraceae bacterium]